MTSISSQQRLQPSDFNFPADQLQRKFLSSAASSNYEHKGELGFKKRCSDHPGSIEAKMLNGCGVEIRRHSFPGSLPSAHEFLPMSNHHELPRERRDRASLDSYVSKSVAKYPSSIQGSQSLFLKYPAPWLGVKKSSIPQSTHSKPHHDQADSSNPSSPDSDSSSGISATVKSEFAKGLTLPAVKSVAISNSGARYSPMFIQHDSFSSPFTSPTIFEKPTATNQRIKEPKQLWTTNPPGKYCPQPNSTVASLHERTQDPQHSGAPGFDGPRVLAESRSSASTLTAPESVLRSAAFEGRELSTEPLSVSSSLPEKLKEGLIPHGLLHSSVRLPESTSCKSLPDNTPPTIPSRYQVTSDSHLQERNIDLEGVMALPDISGLSLIDSSLSKKAASPRLRQKEKNISQPDQAIRSKTSTRERYECDSDVETDPSESDSDSGDIRERELSGIESSEIDSEEDHSRSRSFWHAKKAGNQGINSVTVSVLELYKTEICLNWLRTRNCSYGNKCHYAHGMADLRTRQRIETYKTQPCADPARNGCHVCMYTSRCNYAHPGEPIRRMGPFPGKKYFDPEYFEALRKDYPHHEMPFGVFV